MGNVVQCLVSVFVLPHRREENEKWMIGESGLKSWHHRRASPTVGLAPSGKDGFCQTGEMQLQSWAHKLPVRTLFFVVVVFAYFLFYISVKSNKQDCCFHTGQDFHEPQSGSLRNTSFELFLWGCFINLHVSWAETPESPQTLFVSVSVLNLPCEKVKL